MPKLRYGNSDQVTFGNLHDYYFALGFLANSRNAELRWENNEEQGAWGSEGRIHCLVPQARFPQFFRFTAGRGSVYARINCNDYVGTLVSSHNFAYNGRKNNVESIVSTVPEMYRDDFWHGYGSKLSIDPEYKEKTVPQKKNEQAAPVAPPPPKIEKPKPYDVNIGEVLIHRAFGEGTVYAINGSVIRIKFTSVGEKGFVNPDAFLQGFLRKAD